MNVAHYKAGSWLVDGGLLTYVLTLKIGVLPMHLKLPLLVQHHAFASYYRILFCEVTVEFSMHVCINH